MNNESSSTSPSVDAEALREQVKAKYSEVATNPKNKFHFSTGRALARKFGYDEAITSKLPDHAIESFAGVANPFSLRDIAKGKKVVDLGSGAGFDCFIAAKLVGDEGKVVGVDMTPEMLSKAQQSAAEMDLTNTEFRNGLLEDLPIQDNWADVVISNGVINLCSDKPKVLLEVMRILKPGGYLQFADIANSKPVPVSATENIDLWTA